MKTSSIDLREKIVTSHFLDNISIRKVAVNFGVSKSLVQKLVKQQRVEGNLYPKKPGKPQISHLTNAEVELRTLVSENHDATLLDLCELFATKTGNWVSRTAMCVALQRLNLNRKKKRYGVAKQQQKESKY
jgi:transposase